MKMIGSKGNIDSARARSNAAAKRNEDLLPLICDIRAGGDSTLGQIARALNERGITAARGGSWGSVQVGRILAPTRTTAYEPSLANPTARIKLIGGSLIRPIGLDAPNKSQEEGDQ